MGVLEPNYITKGRSINHDLESLRTKSSWPAPETWPNSEITSDHITSDGRLLNKALISGSKATTIDSFFTRVRPCCHLGLVPHDCHFGF